MSHAQYTKELTFETAEKLIENGEKPTINNIRKAMGGGSPNDVTEWMREFRHKQQQVAIAKQVPIPENIREQATVQTNDLLDQIWDTARTIANDKLSKERQALNNEREEFETEIAESLEQAENLYNENTSIKEQLAALEKQKTENTQVIENLSREKQDQENKLKELNLVKQTTGKELLELNSENKKLSSSNAKKDGVTEELRKTNLDLTKQLKTVQSELNKTANKVESAQLSSKQAKTELTSSKKELKTVESENKTLNLQVQTQQISLNTSVSSLDDLKIELKEARKTSLQAEKEVSKLSGKLTVTSEDNKKLENKILELEKMLSLPKVQAKK